ncbi:MAG: replication initiation protein [Paraclostridium bifermentans]|uniref:replication initiation protein n=1 Tax=Paraclostridium bifermentans TaxID=1490 RepID=UPI0011DCDC68|nr:replication initiation protein [Paraclostridium bifermentans]MBS6509889.1 replication initiation protein [Paraclostridium bifermentans]MDU3804313.1 replication initiation protein [Paraclostridium bifermentans]
MNDYRDIQNPKILMKNNLLIQAKYSLTLVENRIFLLMMYKLQKESNGVLSCEISHDEFKQIIKHAKDKTIKNISKSLSSLRKKSIFFMEEKANKKGIIWGEYGFLNGFTYDDERKIFKIEASEKIYDLLNNYLQTGYTPANLAALFSMKNYYSQRLYDLLRLWSGTKSVINYSLEDLKMYLQLDESYPEYGNFKRRVILPAIKELNETGYFEIDFKENKIGRKVDSIDFYVKDLDKRKYFTNEDVIADIPSLVVKEVEVTNDNAIFDNKEERTFKSNYVISSDNGDKHKISEFEFLVPDEDIFTKGTLRSFKKDFRNIDFKNEYMEKAFDDAVSITLERDDVEIIKVSSYKFFKGCLDNKIVEYKLEEKEDVAHKKEMDVFW